MSETNEISLERLLHILRTRLRLISSVFLAGVLVAAGITAITPEMYFATTSLNFDFRSANPIDSQSSTLDEDAYLNTQMDILKSLNVAMKVEESMSDYELERLIEAVEAQRTPVENFFSYVKNIFRSLGSSGDKAENSGVADGQDHEPVEAIDVHSAHSWVARMLGFNLVVEPRINSRIVDVSYWSTDPRLAAFMANSFAEAYLATNLDMTIDPARKTTQWFGQRIESLRRKLETAQAELTAYQQQEGVVSSDEKVDTENERLSELSSQLVVAQKESRSAVFAQKKLHELQEKNAPLTTFSVVFENSVIKSIKAEIRKLEGDLVEMSASLGENHPKRKRASAELAAARKRLDDEVRVITDGINNNAELTVAREQDLEDAVNEQKRVVLALKSQFDRIAVLRREVDSAQAAYNSALVQFNTTDMQSLIDQTNVTIVDPANIPRTPASPELTKNLVLGGLAGWVLGIAIAILMELFGRRVHSREDIEVELGIPLLGHLK